MISGRILTLISILCMSMNCFAQCGEFFKDNILIQNLRFIGENLNNSQYVLEENLTRSSNKTYIVIDKVSNQKIALFKPNRGIQENIESIYPVIKRNLALREEVSYWVSQKIDLFKIAPSIHLTGDQFGGALILWQDGFKNYYDYWVKHYQTYPSEDIEDLEYLLGRKENLKVQELALFDYIIGNLDRNLKNLLINDNKEIVGVDHSISFPVSSKKLTGAINTGWNRGSTAKTLIDQDLLDRVMEINIDNFVEDLKTSYPLLESRAVLLTKQRLKILQTYIQKKYPLRIRKLSQFLRFHHLYLKKIKLNQIN